MGLLMTLGSRIFLRCQSTPLIRHREQLKAKPGAPSISLFSSRRDQARHQPGAEM